MSYVKRHTDLGDSALRMAELGAGEKAYVEFHVDGAKNVATFYIDDAGCSPSSAGSLKYEAGSFVATKSIDYISCASSSDPGAFSAFDAFNFAQITLTDTQQKDKANFIADSATFFQQALSQD